MRYFRYVNPSTVTIIYYIQKLELWHEFWIKWCSILLKGAVQWLMVFHSIFILSKKICNPSQDFGCTEEYCNIS
jgi:hypothetical protein